MICLRYIEISINNSIEIMTHSVRTLLILVLISGISLNAQEITSPQGVRVLENKSFDDSPTARQEILELYEDLRVADVMDGMDLVGLQDMGLFYNNIRPYWVDTENFTHRIVGFALTVRFVPNDRRIGEGSFDNIEGYQKWYKDQYARAPHAWTSAAKDGDILVISSDGTGEAANIGSNNTLWWYTLGIRGVVTNASARDQDEIVAEKVMPVYGQEDRALRSVRAGRCILDSYNFPVVCAGVLVFPGDLVVADMDGVLVVPREKAMEVGKAARAIMKDDQASREKQLKEIRAKQASELKKK